MPDPRQPFRVVVAGAVADPDLLHRKLDALLARKLRTDAVELLFPEGGLGLAAALWAERNGVAAGPYGPPTAYDANGVSRNASLLKDGDAFIGVGPRTSWLADAEDLIRRAEVIGFRVRLIGG